ncbi:hypothetical protein QFC22_002913 [Naganishia vaughanmartiniae]|uniref:Uncharacterized protein n=1 Tax=Naganishia vaughanmartiniae TaxID=1424756 RepID=A0ACC2X9B2_9TREE|nr:hypothetical protein QFC22_002913 [Naganishia vaughanmartiniae]
MTSAPPPTAISAAAGTHGQGNADLMFSWKGVQGLLDESAELNDDDDEEDSDAEAQVIDAPTGRHAGDISFTGSELYPDDGHAQASSPTGGPLYGSTGPTTPTTRRNDSPSDSESDSSMDEVSESEENGDTQPRLNHEEQVLSSSPTQLDTLLPPATHQTHLLNRKPRERLRDLPKLRTLRLPSGLPTTNSTKNLLPGRRIQSQTIPPPASSERTPLLSRARRENRAGSVNVPPRPSRAQTDQGVASSTDGKGAPRMDTKRLGLPRRWLAYITNPSPGTIRVLKCSIAYLLASLFTFVPQLSALLSTTHETDVHGRVMPRPAYSAHMVATVMVYFHPGRSIGSMFLASKYCIILALLAALFSSASILTLQLFDHFFPEEGTWGFQAGDVTVLVLWIGSSMAGLAWLKQWVNNPSFNTGCSMAAVTLFTVVVKEGGFAKLGEVLLIVVVGASISNFVCFTLWPQSATTKLQTSIGITLDSFSTLFRLLNATFLLDRPPNDASFASLQTAAQSHSAAFTQLKADLGEAQHERLLDRRINAKQRERYAAVTDSLTRLAQHLTGMRGGTGLQSDLLRGTKQGILEVKTDSSSNSDSEDTTAPHDVNQQESQTHGKRKLRGDDDLSKAGNLFWAFRDEVAEEMRQLTDLACKVLHDVKLAMTDLNSSADHSTLLNADHALLQAALKDFTSTTLHAINRLYHGTLRKPDSAIFGLPHASDSGSSEAVYLIYFFIFTLEEFVREEIQLVEAMCELVAGSHRATFPSFTRWFSPARWRRQIKSKGKDRGLRRGILQLNPLDPSDLQPPVFPKRDKNNSNTLTTPSRATLTKRERVYQALWALQARLRENDIKYALKTARIRLVNAMSRLDTRTSKPRYQKGNSKDDKGNASPPDTRHLLYFAYAMAMQGVIKELEYVGGTLQDVFGIINQSTRAEFDALFV